MKQPFTQAQTEALAQIVNDGIVQAMKTVNTVKKTKPATKKEANTVIYSVSYRRTLNGYIHSVKGVKSLETNSLIFNTLKNSGEFKSVTLSQATAKAGVKVTPDDWQVITEYTAKA